MERLTENVIQRLSTIVFIKIGSDSFTADFTSRVMTAVFCLTTPIFIIRLILSSIRYFFVPCWLSSFTTTSHIEIGITSFLSVLAVSNKVSWEAPNAASTFAIAGTTSAFQPVEWSIYVLNVSYILPLLGDLKYVYGHTSRSWDKCIEWRPDKTRNVWA